MLAARQRESTDAIVATIMIVSWFIAVFFDALVTESEGFLSASEASYRGSAARQPVLVFVAINTLAGVAIVVGGVLRVFRRTCSQKLLVVGAVLTLVSFATFHVVVYTDVSAAATFCFALSLGWLISKDRTRD